MRLAVGTEAILQSSSSGNAPSSSRSGQKNTVEAIGAGGGWEV